MIDNCKVSVKVNDELKEVLIIDKFEKFKTFSLNGSNDIVASHETKYLVVDNDNNIFTIYPDQIKKFIHR